MGSPTPAGLHQHWEDTTGSSVERFAVEALGADVGVKEEGLSANWWLSATDSQGWCAALPRITMSALPCTREWDQVNRSGNGRRCTQVRGVIASLTQPARGGGALTCHTGSMGMPQSGALTRQCVSGTEAAVVTPRFDAGRLVNIRMSHGACMNAHTLAPRAVKDVPHSSERCVIRDVRTADSGACSCAISADASQGRCAAGV